VGTVEAVRVVAEVADLMRTMLLSRAQELNITRSDECELVDKGVDANVTLIRDPRVGFLERDLDIAILVRGVVGGQKAANVIVFPALAREDVYGVCFGDFAEVLEPLSLLLNLPQGSVVGVTSLGCGAGGWGACSVLA
jgi:hypothetical protein